jgi:putative SOS response-associated peptidase YedK
MCGRVVTSSPRAIVEAIFELTFVDERYAPHYNIRPTDPVAILRKPHELEMARWDLISSTWSGPLKTKPLMINARVESIRSRPSFRDLVDTKRCAVVVDGFYEWKKEGQTKTPHYVHRADGQPQAFAGLWDEWTDPATGEIVLSATILTGEPAGVMIGLHDRMPLVVPRNHLEKWLDRATSGSDALAMISSEASADGWIMREVAPLVNAPATDGPQLIAPSIAPQGRLF